MTDLLLVEKVREAIKPIIMWDGDRLDMNLTRDEITAVATAAIATVEAHRPPVTVASLDYRVQMVRDDDCLQASLATLLGLPLAAIPRFDEEAIPGKNQNGMARQWLASQGYAMDALTGPRRIAGMHIKCGQSPRGCGHASVYDGDELFHDPHPEGGGIVGEIEENILVRPLRLASPGYEAGLVEGFKQGIEAAAKVVEDAIPMPGSLMQTGTPAQALFIVTKLVRALSPPSIADEVADIHREARKAALARFVAALSTLEPKL